MRTKRSWLRPAALSLAMLAAVPVSVATAQEWVVDAYGGGETYGEVATGVGTWNGVLGLRYSGPGAGWLYVSGAVPFGAGDPVWGAGGAGRRLTLVDGGIGAGLDLAAHGHGYRSPATVSAAASVGGGGTVELLPTLVLGSGAVRWEARSGIIGYAGGFGDKWRTRAVHENGTRLILRPDRRLELSGQARYVRASEAGYPYFGGSASFDQGGVAIWGSVGKWASDAIPGLGWGAGASVRASDRLEFWGVVRQATADPIYWNQRRQGWSLGLSRRLGGAARALAAAPAVTVGRSTDRITIRLPVSRSGASPAIAGDFNGWQPIPMAQSGDEWYADLVLSPGRYQYAFRSADGRWFVPEGTPGRVSDDMGGWVAVLLVY